MPVESSQVAGGTAVGEAEVQIGALQECLDKEQSEVL